MMKKMKNNNINKTGLIIGAFCLIMVSCKAPSLTPTEKIELPEFYMDRETDSTTISSMSWKTFFPDTLLQSYIAEALNNNHSFLQTIERISIARSQVRVGKGALLPDLSLGIDGGVQRFGEYTMDGVGNSTTNTPDLEKDKHIPDPYRNFNLGLNFQWEADIWGKLTDKKRSTVSRWMQSVEAMRLARTLLISEVGTHYFELLPRGYDIEWSGVTREEKDSGGQTVLIFGICLLFVYLLLAAQYESLLLPFPVILSLPAGIFGSYFFLQLAGLENNIYAQVALVMLIGLLGKNAILIVEMANQYRKQGMSIFDAAVRGSVSRLRPILMTSFAFICGLIPLVMASGAGALGNRSIGTAAAGGMFIGTFVGIFLVPGLYLIFESWSAHLNRNKVSYDEEDEK